MAQLFELQKHLSRLALLRLVSDTAALLDIADVPLRMVKKRACQLFTQRFQSIAMVLPYKIATLLYCFNERDEVLLLERAQEPNRGLWSPCGGKLHTDIGESPYACACREAEEEMGVTLTASDLHLAGLVSEHGFLGQSHWLMFLFEVKKKLTAVPPVHREGRFQFFSREAMEGIPLPQTDRERIWPWFWEFRGGFFAAHCHCHPDGENVWTLEEVARVESRGAAK